MTILKCVPHVHHAHFCRSANQIFTLDDIAADLYVDKWEYFVRLRAIIIIIIILQRRNHYEMQNALYLKISFEVCPILEWSKKNPAEDNLLKKKLLVCFSTEKKNICLVIVSWEKGLPLTSSPPPKKSNSSPLVVLGCEFWT